jgi:FkbM family methyltransferase
MSGHRITWRAVVRNAQTYLPARLHERRLDAQQTMRRWSGRPHEREFAALRHLLHADAHVLDVGANRGQSIDSLRSLGIPLRITAFEPQRELAWRLMARYPDVDVRQVGLGDSHGEVKLFTPSYRGYRFDGLASCDYETAVAWFAYSVWPYREDRITVMTEVITVMPLDDCHRLDPVDFIKIDAQGMELAVLLGAERTLRRDRPLLLLETPDAEIIEWLAGLGYRLFHAAGDRLVAPTEAWVTNAYFAHADTALTAMRNWCDDELGPTRPLPGREHMVDGVVYWDSLSRRQKVHRDPAIKRSPIRRLWLSVTDFNNTNNFSS